MAYSARILADSITEQGDRLTTLEVTFPRIVLPEFNTHRMLSRNSASSRAIPVEKMISAVEADPFVPSSFGKNQRGMSSSEDLTGDPARIAHGTWMRTLRWSIDCARQMAWVGVHKQIANRLLEPFCWQTVVVTATEWSNYFALRCSHDAQPEIRTISEMMRDAIDASSPRVIRRHGWHTPFVDDEEVSRILEEATAEGASAEHTLVGHVSAGRCARVSYLTHDGRRDWRADLELSLRLRRDGHMSPFEHVARPMTKGERSYQSRRGR